MIGKSRPGMKFRQLIRKKTQNWTHLETAIFFNILVDSEINFYNALETKALKKSSNKEVFEALKKEFRATLLDNDFLEDNRKLIPEGTQADLDTSIEKLRNKYNNIKNNWRKNFVRARTGSGLDVKKDQSGFKLCIQIMRRNRKYIKQKWITRRKPLTCCL